MKRRRALAVIGAGVVGAAATGNFVLLPPSPSKERRSVDDIARELHDELAGTPGVVDYDHPLRQVHNRGVPTGGVSVFGLSRRQRQLVVDMLYAGLSDAGQQRVPNEYFARFPGVHVMKALFCGDPHKPPYTFLLTGPHLNLRVGGASREGYAFGGPQVYGDQHGNDAKGLPGNVYAYQLALGQQLWSSLSSSAQEQAAVAAAPVQTQIEFRNDSGAIPGVLLSTTSGPALAAADAVIDGILSTYPKDDAAYARSCILESGGVAEMRASFYERGSDGEPAWGQIFRLEGPAAVLYFRGAPHVHAYVNIAMKPVPLSVGDVVGENPVTIEGAALARLFERAMKAATGAGRAEYDAGDVVGRLRAGTIRTGDIYVAESWQAHVIVKDTKYGARAFAVSDESAMLATGEPPLMLRDVVVDYVKKHGFA